MNKKNLVQAGAIISTMISVWLWIWYGSLPSMDQTTTSFNEEESTWQDLKIKQEVIR